MLVGPYEFTIGLQAKILLASLFLCFFWAAAYLRAKYLNEIADTPEHVIHFNGHRFLGPYPRKKDK